MTQSSVARFAPKRRLPREFLFRALTKVAARVLGRVCRLALIIYGLPVRGLGGIMIGVSPGLNGSSEIENDRTIPSPLAPMTDCGTASPSYHQASLGALRFGS